MESYNFLCIVFLQLAMLNKQKVTTGHILYFRKLNSTLCENLYRGDYYYPNFVRKKFQNLLLPAYYTWKVVSI